MGRAGEEVAQKHSVFLSTVGAPRGEDTTHSRSRTHLTNRKRKRGGKKYGAADAGVWDLQFTENYVAFLLGACCLPVWWDLCSGKGLIM